MSTQFDRITIDPTRMNGQPCIRGMPDRAELKREYPESKDYDIRQTLEFAASSLDDQIIALGAA